MAKNPTVHLLGQAVFDPSYESSHFLTTPDAVALKSQFLGGNNNVYFFVIKTTIDSVACSVLAIINLFYYSFTNEPDEWRTITLTHKVKLYHPNREIIIKQNILPH